MVSPKYETTVRVEKLVNKSKLREAIFDITQYIEDKFHTTPEVEYDSMDKRMITASGLNKQGIMVNYKITTNLEGSEVPDAYSTDKPSAMSIHLYSFTKPVKPLKRKLTDIIKSCK